MYTLDYKDYAACARQAAAEGILLLKNKEQLLPLEAGSKLALFGRTQYDTIYCGTGSGGMVNVPYVISIYEALKEDYQLSDALHQRYSSWRAENPFDEGEGWAATPWSQREMPLPDELLEDVRQFSDTAVFVIGRTAGEDRDNAAIPGAYYLSETELSVLRKLRKRFPKLVVLVNAGNIIDLSWDEEIDCDALLYLWQGGSEGGHAAADVMTGRVNPSAALPDTIARRLEDYPAHGHFGGAEESVYAEDIYVGYRYFSSFAPEAVLYPFGYGLSYTSFTSEMHRFTADDKGRLKADLEVRNSGKRAGKAVLQLYIEAPQGLLPKPSRVLAAFHKTKRLAPGESERFSLEIEPRIYASYEDRPQSAYAFSWILEKGEYKVYSGFDSVSAEESAVFSLPETQVLEKLEQALAPSKAFKRLRPGKNGEKTWEEVPLKKQAFDETIRETAPPFDPAAAGRRFDDWVKGEISLDEFLEGRTDDELIRMSFGLGMGPSGVTAGVAGAIGGVTEKLLDAGIPRIACADGPSGIRMDDGTMAFSLPNGSCLAASFNEALNEELFSYLGLELRKNHIASILGPGMNIHRYPLNGRNFEYFSEDPLLTGRMAAAQARGLNRQNTAATVKHFALNNQEYKRHDSDSRVSERAAREIYLKAFEIAVRSGEVKSIMSGYNPINGRQCASNYALNTVILREDWGYDGIVMSDWWAGMNKEDYGAKSREDIAAMIRAQNDLYMVINDAEQIAFMDKIRAEQAEGVFGRAELLRNAKNICRFVRRYAEDEEAGGVKVLHEPEIRREQESLIDLGKIGKRTPIDFSGVSSERGQRVLISFQTSALGFYELRLLLSSEGPELAQMNIIIKNNKVPIRTLSMRGTTEKHEEIVPLDLCIYPDVVLELIFAESGITLHEGELIFRKAGEK